jgi:DNA primase
MNYTDLKEIKQRILKENKLDTIFQVMGCEHIEYKHNRIEAQLPYDKFQSKNSRSVQCKLKESLNCAIRNKSFHGDIYALVSYIKFDKREESDIKANLHEAKKFICETLGWREYLKGRNYKPKVDYLSSLRELQRPRKHYKETIPNPILSEDILSEYIPYPHYWWIEEGISYNTQLHYGIGFDLQSDRITIPIRNQDGQLVGVKGRTVDENEERKYLYLHQLNMSNELFNFHNAKEYIQKEQKVYIFEAEKSPMLLHSNNVYNSVGVASSSISETQARMIKGCGINIKIIVCFDKDKTIEDIKTVAKVFGNRDVYALYDVDGLLDEKNSPIDKGIDIFKKLEEEYCFLIEKEE